MAGRVHLQNFRFSIYIDADGTVTLTDLPPELRDVAAALDPSYRWGTACARPAATPAPPSDQTRPCPQPTAADAEAGG
jgi:hypothetical protein